MQKLVSIKIQDLRNYNTNLKDKKTLKIKLEIKEYIILRYGKQIKMLNISYIFYFTKNNIQITSLKCNNI